MVDLSVSLSGIRLDNPIIPASGTFGFGRDFVDLYDLRILGSISFKGTTRDPRFGNPTPRIAESPSGMLNAIGLQNPGVDEVIRTEIPFLEEHYGKPVIANISGFSLDEYAECAEKLDACGSVGILEINISCPNVHGGGMSFGVSCSAAADVTRAVKEVVKDTPVYIKLSPNVTDIAEMAQACQEAGADGLSLINTFTGLRLDLARRKPILANRTGGVSGDAVLPMALRMIWDVYEAVDIPIIGMGGVSSAEGVLEMMMCGASAVQIGSANLVNPFACRDIIADLPAVAERYGFSQLSDAIGAAHDGKELGSE